MVPKPSLRWYCIWCYWQESVHSTFYYSRGPKKWVLALETCCSCPCFYPLVLNIVLSHCHFFFHNLMITIEKLLPGTWQAALIFLTRDYSTCFTVKLIRRSNGDIFSPDQLCRMQKKSYRSRFFGLNWTLLIFMSIHLFILTDPNNLIN